MRPASESASCGSSSTLADPVSRKRPGVRARSTADFSAANSAGTRCTSSSTTRGGRSSTKPAGSASAAVRNTSSSKLKYA